MITIEPCINKIMHVISMYSEDSWNINILIKYNIVKTQNLISQSVHIQKNMFCSKLWRDDNASIRYCNFTVGDWYKSTHFPLTSSSAKLCFTWLYLFLVTHTCIISYHMSSILYSDPQEEVKEIMLLIGMVICFNH